MATLTTIVVGRVGDEKTDSVYTVAEEPFTSVFDTPVFLFHRNLTASSTVVSTLDGLTIYVEGVGDDYTVNDLDGSLTILSTGSMLDAENYIVGYTFTDYSLAYKINVVTSIAQNAGKNYWVKQASTGKNGVAVIVTEL